MYGRYLWSHNLTISSNWTLVHTSWFYFNKTSMDVEAVKTQELLSSFSKLQGAVVIHPCPVCEPRGKRFGIICHAFAFHCSWLCRSYQLCYSCLGHELRMPILSELKQNLREHPATKVTHLRAVLFPALARRDVGSQKWLDVSKAVSPPFSFPLACGGSQALSCFTQGLQELRCTAQHLLSILMICDWFWHSFI